MDGQTKIVYQYRAVSMLTRDNKTDHCDLEFVLNALVSTTIRLRLRFE